MRSSLAWFSLLALYFLTLTCSQSNKNTLPTDKPIAKAPQATADVIARLVEDSAMQAGFLGLSVRELSTQKEVMHYQAGKMFNLASCQKAITTATALELLGENFRFKTLLQVDAQGYIYLKGGGDPTLASQIMGRNVPSLDELMQIFIQKIKAKGIKKIQGIIADETIENYDVMPPHWLWSDMGNYYGAPSYALNVIDNSFELNFKPTRVGKVATITGTNPRLPAEVQFLNEVRTAPAGTGDQASIAGGSYEAVRYVSGTIPLDYQAFSIKGALPDPAYYLAWYFTKILRAEGFEVAEPTTSRRIALAGKVLNRVRTDLYTHESPPLRQICDFVNFYSVNLFAEAILKQIGLKYPTEKPDNTPLRAGINQIKAFWEARGIPRAYFYMLDGSGLSVTNGITPTHMSLLFCEAQKLPTKEAFYASLPVAGVSGTMKGVGAGTVLQNNLRAKTGAMSQVLAYSGYYKGKSGKMYAFCVAVNRHVGKGAYMQQKLTELLESLYSGS